MHTRFMLLTSSALVAMSLLGGCGSSSSPTGPSVPPAVMAVNGATMPAGPIGSTVVILGLNFGVNQAVAGGQVLFSNGTGGTVTATITSSSDWTDNIIVTTVPAGSASGSLVVKTIAGSSVPITFTITQQTAFRPSAVSWTVTNALPVGLSGHALATATLPITTTQSKSFFFVIGGADSTNVPGATVLHTTASGSGGVSGWSATTALPAPVAFAAAVTATPFNSPVTGTYVYVLGGDSTASGKPVATVYKGTVDSNGAVTSWSPTTPLPVAVHSLGAVVFNGNVYVAGGSGAGNVPVAGVYRAVIGSNGNLGAWQALATLPFKRSHFGFGLNGIFLYAQGGDSGTVTPNDSSLSATALSDVVYAQIDVRSGNLTAPGWASSPNKLKKAVSKHTAVVAGGNVLITAGLYNGAISGSTEESYAVLNPDGSTGAFNGATGANTISAVGGGNVFNHAAVGYVDGGGAFHVLVVGGDDVNTPTKKHTGVYYY